MNKMFFDAGFKFTKYVSVSKFLWDEREKYISSLDSRNQRWGAKALRPQDLMPLFEVILDSLLLAAKKALAYSKMNNFQDYQIVYQWHQISCL